MAIKRLYDKGAASNGALLPCLFYEKCVVSFARDFHDFLQTEQRGIMDTVDIVSLSQNVIDLIEKAEKYLANGVQSAWIVQPTLRLISVFTIDTQPTTYTSGTLTDTKLGLTLQMEEIFR